MTCPHCHGSNTIAHSATAANTPRRWCKDCKKAFAINGKKPGPKPIFDAPMTPAERKRRQRQGANLENPDTT